MNSNVFQKYNDLLKHTKSLEGRYSSLSMQYNNLQRHNETIIEKRINEVTDELNKKHQIELTDKENEIEALKREVAKLTSILNNDSSNSGLSTSKTPIFKSKLIPNTREKTDKNSGGQPNHKKHKLEKFEDDEITEIREHIPNTCPKCGDSSISKLDTVVEKDETDYVVKVIKRRHQFPNCKCGKCGKEFHTNIPENLKMENQYGVTIQALAVCLVNEIYTPFNKVVKLIQGITNGEISPSEGYIAKLQPRACNYLNTFINDVTNKFLRSEVMAWDDGVIKIETKDAYLRVYCNGEMVLFKAHEKKDNESIKKDGILNNLPSKAIVMHDHFKGNYGEDYSFRNVECLIHLIRRLIKNEQETKHSWQEKLRHLLKRTNKDRNKLIDEGVSKFDEEYLLELNKDFDDIIVIGDEENSKRTNNQFWDKELTLLKDIKKYKENYLMWAYDFRLPSTNNISERNIRPCKSKMKISGQFRNYNYASYYASIRSYIETCKINGINIIDATAKLMDGNPYTLDDILEVGKQYREKKLVLTN